MVNKWLADFFLLKAYNADDNVSLQKFCVLRAIEFIFNDGDMLLIASWLTENDGKVVINEKALEMKISAELSYNIIRKAFKCSALETEDHNKLKETVFKGQRTDTIIRIDTECNFSRPHPKLKE